MESQNKQDGCQSDDEAIDDLNSTLTVEAQNDEMQEDLPLNSGQNSVVFEVSLHANEMKNFDSLAKMHKVVKSKSQGCKAKLSAEQKWRKRGIWK